MPRVRRDFDEIYRAQDDPWSIGAADSERYELYRRLILERAPGRGAMLDVGCGFGAFLARFRDEFDRLVGVELSELAVAKGARRFPFLELVQGSADRLAEAPLPAGPYDAIVVSDVLYYLDDAGRRRALREVARRLAPGGLAFVAGYCPGGDYLTPAELRVLAERDLVVEDERVLESGHALLVCRRRRRLVALTVDYETWQPVPVGRRIDWERDVFAPAAGLLDVCDAAGARVTLMAEMGEYAWLVEHDPPVAERMAEQWREAVRRGHDVQLHLHPPWLPELGARRTPSGELEWDWSHPTAADYPGDLTELIGRLKRLLEEAIRPAKPDYGVVAFRAGAYEAQPFGRLYEALHANGIGCDSSVYAGGRHPDRHYDYSLAYSVHQPYFASRTDPQLKAPPAERAVVELPVLTYAGGSLWTFDNEEGARFARRLFDECDRPLPPRGRGDSLRERLADVDLIAWQRRGERARTLLGHVYGHAAGRSRRLANALVPRPLARAMAPYRGERLVDGDYFVLVGHTKANLDLDAIAGQLERLRADGRFELVTLSEAAACARAELDSSQSADRDAEARRQVERERAAVLGEERNEALSFRLQATIPLDRRTVLDLGCGGGDWSARIASLHPGARVVGVDAGEEFVARARERFASERVSFEVADFAALPFDDGSFDCVYADNTLEHAFDVDRTLAEAHRVLRDGGALVAAIPSDARNPAVVTDNHTWKTAPHDVRARLEHAGFSAVAIEEVDLYRTLAMPPYPPSDDRMMYVRAWRRPAPERDRLAELVRFVYGALDPDPPQQSDDPLAILAGGHAWCWGYVLVLREALRREGFAVRLVTMQATGHPRGRGPRNEDTHEVLEVELADGGRQVLDAMAGVRFPHGVGVLLRDPSLADVDRPRDGRYFDRDYDLYATSFWYARVARVALRDDPREPPVWLAQQELVSPPLVRRLERRYARARSRAGRALGRGPSG